MNKLCKDFCNIILKKYEKYSPIIIFYGSNIYSQNFSDLDVCLIFKECLNDQIKNEIICETITFQKNNKLKIDEEIPFYNKLIYTIDEIEDIFINSPFRDGEKFKLDNIVKTKEFLSSNLMKKRLFINILTTDHRVVNDKNKLIRKFEQMAWKELLLMLKGVFGTNIANPNNVLDNLYVNPKTHYGGEMHLGYKFGNPNKRKYLNNKVKQICKSFKKINL